MLFRLAGVVICCSAVSALLPAGGIKRTASLVMGLMVLGLWFSELQAAWPDVSLPELPATIFERIQSDAEDLPQPPP